MRSGKVKYCALKILLDSIMSATIYLVSLYPRNIVKRTPQIMGIPVEGYFKLKIKQLYRFNLQSWTIQKYHKCDACI